MGLFKSPSTSCTLISALTAERTTCLINRRRGRATPPGQLPIRKPSLKFFVLRCSRMSCSLHKKKLAPNLIMKNSISHYGHLKKRNKLWRCNWNMLRSNRRGGSRKGGAAGGGGGAAGGGGAGETDGSKARFCFKEEAKEDETMCHPWDLTSKPNKPSKCHPRKAGHWQISSARRCGKPAHRMVGSAAHPL